MREINKVGNGFEGVINFVGDRTGEAADCRELLRLQEGLLGAPALGDVDAEYDDAGDGSVGLAAGLIHEVQIARFKRGRAAAGELDGGASSDVGSTGSINRIEKGKEPLSFGLGHGLAESLAEHRALADKILIRGIDHLENVVRAPQQSEEGGGLLEEVGEAFALLLQLRFGNDRACSFRADDKRAADMAGSIADGAVAVSPVDVFEPAIAIDGNKVVFVPGGLAAGHDGVDLGANDGPYFRPAIATALAQRPRMFVLADARAVGVVIELDQILAPPEKHGMARGEQGIDRDEQRFGPLLDGTDRSARPVEGAGAIGHLAAAANWTASCERWQGSQGFHFPKRTDAHKLAPGMRASGCTVYLFLGRHSLSGV